MTEDVIDFDSSDEWAPLLAAVLKELLPTDFQQLFSSRQSELVEDAQDLLFELGPRDGIISATLDWIRSVTIVGYHGTRLTAEEVASVREIGLVPLDASARRLRLVRALSKHPQWKSVEGRLDKALYAYGRGQRAGEREGQVHLTLSRSGLIDDFNHYLTHGSEFDQEVAHDLLDEEGKGLLSEDGTPTVLTFGVPGAIALDAADPFSGIDDMRDRGDVSNVVNAFLKAWSYALAYPDFQSSSLQVDCGLFFQKSVPAEWLISAASVASPGAASESQ